MHAGTKRKCNTTAFPTGTQTTIQAAPSPEAYNRAGASGAHYCPYRLAILKTAVVYRIIASCGGELL